MPKNELDEDRTRHRLIEAAGEVFAERGLKDATVRDICRIAKANVAAVNYHFGDKQSLYAAALRYAHDCARKYDADMVQPDGASVEVRLRAFLRAMLMGFFEDGKPAWHGKLVAREMADPSEVLQEIINRTVRPRFMILAGIVRTVLGPDAPEAVVRNCARSVVGQALFYHFTRPMMSRLFPDEAFDSTRVDELVEHVATFSLHGLRGVAHELKSKKNAPERNGAKARGTRGGGA